MAEKRLPSDRLLMWLLARLDPRRFAAPWELRKDGAADPQATARESFPALLDALPDVASTRRHGQRDLWDHSRRGDGASAVDASRQLALAT